MPSNPNSQLIKPIRRGSPCEWDAMESVWEYTFQHVLNVAPQDHHVLLTERPLTKRANREKAVQIMLEKFSTPATYVSMQALLALYGAGRTSGTVVDVGDSFTSVVPVRQGTPVTEAILNVDLAGCYMEDYLSAALNLGDQDMAREVMEKVCGVSASNGTVVTIGAERFQCGREESKPLHEIIMQSVTACPPVRNSTHTSYLRCGWINDAGRIF
uniref:Actin n=1 Tax=Anopheles christyi TaxID=43041 RepID=A0A182JYM2_9DIPT